MSASEIRQHFGLGRQRFNTIARDARFSGLLPDDELPLTSVPRLTKELYRLRDDSRGLAALRRSVQASKRTKRVEDRRATEAFVSPHVDSRVGKYGRNGCVFCKIRIFQK